MKQKLLALSLGFIIFLSGCNLNVQPEGTAFVYAMLCNRYFGEVSEDYLRLALVSPEQAAEDYEAVLAAEMAYVCDYFGVKQENADAEQLRSFVEAVYARSSFEVGEQQVSGGGITVPVRVWPLRLFDHITSEDYVPVVLPLWEKYGVSTDETSIASLSAAQYRNYTREFLSAILTLVESRLADAPYGDAQTVQLRLERDGGYYRPNAEDLAAIHALVLGYE